MSPIKNVALVNELGQVVNHVVVDTDDTKTMDALHQHWNTHRHVETTETDVIILDADPEIWTTHCDNPDCDNQGFTLPNGSKGTNDLAEKLRELYGDPDAHVTKKKSELPSDSWLLEENAHLRTAGWKFPDNMTIIDDED